MKTSNKILLIAAGSMFALVLFMIIIFRLTAMDKIFADRGTDKTIQTTGEINTKSYDLSDFNVLNIAGTWDIRVHRADTYQVIIKAPANVLAALKVDKIDKTLNLGNMRDIRLLAASQHLQAEISLPLLTGVYGSGDSRLELKDFTTDKLTLNFSGTGQLTGSGNRITQLAIECSGAADIDLNQSTITNANLNVSGAAQIKLNMTGGMLTGQISGLANVTYAGTVLSEDIKTSGLAKVKRRD